MIGNKSSFKTNRVSNSLRLQSPILEIPQNIQVVTAKLINNQQIFDMLEGVTRNVSEASRVEHWDNYARITMRGSNVEAFRSFINMADHLWQGHSKEIQEKESLGIYFANLPTDPVEIAVNHCPGTYYNSDYYHYDQYSGKELPATGSYAGKFKDAAIADKIVRMNYDIHVGAVLGLPGKILAFFASLIAASLPVTGFYIWWGRRKKSKKTLYAKEAFVASATV